MKTNTLTAETAYENAHHYAAEAAAKIGDLLFDMPAPGGDTKIHWGYVGDLNRINGLLSEVLAVLAEVAR